jgi:phage terminase large subunit GpA-like protein
MVLAKDLLGQKTISAGADVVHDRTKVQQYGFLQNSSHRWRNPNIILGIGTSDESSRNVPEVSVVEKGEHFL